MERKGEARHLREQEKNFKKEFAKTIQKCTTFPREV